MLWGIQAPALRISRWASQDSSAPQLVGNFGVAVEVAVSPVHGARFADTFHRGQANKVNDRRLHDDATNALDEELLDELFAEGELISLL